MASGTHTPPGQQETPTIAVRRMDEYDRNVRDEVVGVILDGFTELSVFSKDRRKLTAALRDDVRADLFYVAELAGSIAGVLACSGGSGRALAANRTSLRRSLGYLRGTVAMRLLARELNTPLSYGADTGYIEWVATRGNARGQGVSTALFRHVMRHLPYRELVLEVVDANDRARSLYDTLGFVEHDRVPAKGLERLTFTERISMRWRPSPVDGRG